MDKASLIGRTIDDKYEIEELVGQGAMGAVYRVRQTTLGTKLALKVLHRANAAEPMFAARFLREAQAASRVDHPSSLRVVDFGEEPDGLLYIAMELVDGRTLAEIMTQEGPMPIRRIVDIASQALAALAVAHDLGVVHRDIKPENIMVLSGKDDEGNACDIVKVCDFGVAKIADPARAISPSVTAEGMVVGTPEYMSPEQARGETCDARSDLYSMGVLLFHLMTGKVPFDSSTAFGTALMHVTEEPTRPTLLDPSIDMRLEAICLKAMRKKPSDRYASARELRSALRALVDDAAKRGEREEEANAMWEERMKLTDQIEKTKPRSGLLVAAVVAVAAIAGGSTLIQRGREPAPTAQVGTATLQAGKMPAPLGGEARSAADAKAAADARPGSPLPAPLNGEANADAKAEADAKAKAEAEAEAKRARMPTRVGATGGGVARGGARKTKAHATDQDSHGPGDAKDPADLPLPVFPDPPAAPESKPQAPAAPPPLPPPASGGGTAVP